MTDDLVQAIGIEADEITGAGDDTVIGAKATESGEGIVGDEDEEILAAIMEALEFAGAAVDTGEVLQELGVETKGARTFANQIVRLAELAGNQRSKQILSALAVVVAHSRPEEWPALAAILSRSVPKASQEQAGKIAEKMREEAKIGYAKPGYPEYPEPQEKTTGSDAERGQGMQASTLEVKALSERVDAIGSEVAELRAAINGLQDAIATLGAVVSAETKAMPVTRDVAVSPVAALLVEKLTRGS